MALTIANYSKCQGRGHEGGQFFPTRGGYLPSVHFLAYSAHYFLSDVLDYIPVRKVNCKPTVSKIFKQNQAIRMFLRVIMKGQGQKGWFFS